MDARLVWDTWRRILTDDRLVARVLHPDTAVDDPARLSDAEEAILADYASTTAATNSNIEMYRMGLVRNALGALSLVPASRHLLYSSGVDVDEVASAFVQSIGYVDDGPRFWRIADGFVAYLMTRPEFARQAHQDVLALDAAAAALARRLGESPGIVWPESTALEFSQNGSSVDAAARLVASPAASVTSSSCDLTPWLENADDFDAEDDLAPGAKHWLIFFAAADAAHEYAELSERAARAFSLLSTPMTLSELSRALDGLPPAETNGVVTSLRELGVVVIERDA